VSIEDLVCLSSHQFAGDRSIHFGVPEFSFEPPCPSIRIKGVAVGIGSPAVAGRDRDPAAPNLATVVERIRVRSSSFRVPALSVSVAVYWRKVTLIGRFS